MFAQGPQIAQGPLKISGSHMNGIERMRLAADLRRAFPRNPQILAAANELELVASTSVASTPVASTPVASTPVDTTPVASTNNCPVCAKRKAAKAAAQRRWRAR
jgi:hypothetical protein